MAPVAAPIILSEVLRVSLKINSFDDHEAAILTFRHAGKSTITLSMTLDICQQDLKAYLCVLLFPKLDVRYRVRPTLITDRPTKTTID